MEQISFLDKLATQIISDFGTNFSTLEIILPNKRAKLFLYEAIQKQISNNVFAPNIISIEDFIQDIAQIRSIDQIEVLFEFYDVYQSITPQKSRQVFEVFANWAKMLLQDFNEIDRYLKDPLYVLSYLKDIEDIKKWGVTLEQKTPLLEKYIDFWKLLPTYYSKFYEHLCRKKIGYQGLIYREAVKKANEYSASNSHKNYIFAGFNALNKAEETIIQLLLSQNKAKIYWDADKTFIDDLQHDAGMFLRNFKSNWKHYRSNNFNWIFDEFSQSKNIQIIGTPKIVGQAKITGKILEQILKSQPEIDFTKVAVVLGEENLLLPLLHSLPSNIGNLNITMGYSSKNNPAQLLVSLLFKLHNNTLKRNATQIVFYYKDLLNILNHPLVKPYINGNKLVETINHVNFTFIPIKKLFEIYNQDNPFFEALFQSWNSNGEGVLIKISEILLFIKNFLNSDKNEDRIAKSFLYSVYKTINKLINYQSLNSYITNLDTLFSIYKQVIDLADVSFEGEPLRGLQIMGVLESRVLDFETVVITAMNEGKFPSGKSINSFIPYDLKKELELPTFKEKDAIYAYHFYHLLQRAKNIYLIYNTDSNGLDGGEKSRFITQLEVETQKSHNLTHQIYNANLPTVQDNTKFIKKSKLVQDRLKELASLGFSPSALTSYIRNPFEFYLQKILKIKPLDEVEENIALNTLGTIIHKTLEVLYTPFLNKTIQVSDIENCIKNIDNEVLTQFKEIYKEGEIKKGKNLLVFEVAKRHIFNFLNQELETLATQTIQLLYLEHTFECQINSNQLPYSVKIKGNVDRIDLLDGQIRIMDYKTGKVEQKNITLKTFENLTKNPKNDKIIQLLCYSLMYAKTTNTQNIETGIFSFKNVKSGFMPFKLNLEKQELKVTTVQILEDFEEQIIVLLKEILDPEIDFIEKII
jgi:hypothetical protein